MQLYVQIKYNLKFINQITSSQLNVPVVNVCASILMFIIKYNWYVFGLVP